MISNRHILYLKNSKIIRKFTVLINNDAKVVNCQSICLIVHSKNESTTGKSLNFFMQSAKDNVSTNTKLNVQIPNDEEGIYSKLRNKTSGNYYHEKVILGYSREQMCDLVFNVEKYKEFVPWCIDSHILEANGSSQATANKKINLNLLKKNKTVALNLNETTSKKEIQTPKSFKARLEIGFPPIKESYVSHVSMIRPHLVKAISRDTNLFEYLINEWKFHPHDLFDSHLKQPVPISSLKERKEGTKDQGNEKNVEKSCIVEFYVSFKFRSKIYDQLSSLFLDQVFKNMVGAFNKRAEILYGKPSIQTKKLNKLN
jgi:coenzyme Q-binding protein COQ10